MSVVILDTGRTMEPFGDAVRDMPAGTGTLGGHQDALASITGGNVIHAPMGGPLPVTSHPTLVLADHVFLSRRLVRALRGMPGDAPFRVALPASRFTELYAQHMETRVGADGSHAYDAWWFPRGIPSGTAPSLLASMDARAVPFREKRIPFDMPPQIMGRAVHQHPLTTTVAMHLLHWVHVLWLGNLWPQIELVERITQSPLSTGLRLLRALRPTPAGTRYAVARSFNYVGRGVDIHPTACVELSVLGDGVKVGPFALVRGAVLGRGVHVEERANVMFSTLGDGCFVSKNSTVFACVGFPEADLCINGMQYCVAGRHSALTSWVKPMDMKHRADVTIRVDGRTVTVRELMVGACFGHGVFVGPDVLIGPAREIPNGTVVAPPAGSVITRVDPALRAGGGVAVVKDGVLVPASGRDAT